MKIKLVMPALTQWMLLINLAGVALSVFMWHTAITQKVIGCLTGGGCEIVLQSPYAKIFAVPIAAYGVAFYGVNALITLFRLIDDRPVLRFATWKMSGIGILASLYFLYLEIFPIKAFCSWCTVSTFLTIFLLAISWIEIKRNGGIKAAWSEGLSLFKRR